MTEWVARAPGQGRDRPAAAGPGGPAELEENPAGDLVMFQQMGVGVAVSLLIDAAIVRSVLMPATLAVLGDRAWYLPRSLGWLPRLTVEAPAVSPGRGAPAQSSEPAGDVGMSSR